MAGQYFEQFKVGQLFKHSITRTVTETDNMNFCNATYNTQPLHIDFHFASKTEFGKPLVNSVFTLGLVIGLGITDTTLGTTVGNLGMTDCKFPGPVFHGDTIRAETEVMSLRESKSRPTQGIVEFEHRGYNQDGKLICSCRRMALMHKSPKAA